MNAVWKGNKECNYQTVLGDRKIWKNIRDQRIKKQGILSGIDFTIQRGDMAAIMGPSGSGKSTFLYQISGMDRADEGEIWYRDMELGHMTERERAAFRPIIFIKEKGKKGSKRKGGKPHEKAGDRNTFGKKDH